MGAYRYIAYFVTLVFGGALAYALLSPLGLLLYLLIWIDVFILPRLYVFQSFGFELQTLAAIIAGIALGALGGFILALAIPLLILILQYIVFSSSSLFLRVPNITYISMALSAGFAGLIIGALPFFIVIILSVLFRHIVHAMLNFRISFGTDIISATINTIFSVFFMLLLQNSGLLGLFV